MAVSEIVFSCLDCNPVRRDPNVWVQTALRGPLKEGWGHKRLPSLANSSISRAGPYVSGAAVSRGLRLFTSRVASPGPFKGLFGLRGVPWPHSNPHQQNGATIDDPPLSRRGVSGGEWRGGGLQVTTFREGRPI